MTVKFLVLIWSKLASVVVCGVFLFSYCGTLKSFVWVCAYHTQTHTALFWPWSTTSALASRFLGNWPMRFNNTRFKKKKNPFFLCWLIPKKKPPTCLCCWRWQSCGVHKQTRLSKWVLSQQLWQQLSPTVTRAVRRSVCNVSGSVVERKERTNTHRQIQYGTRLRKASSYFLTVRLR